jgi:hypothetical protein
MQADVLREAAEKALLIGVVFMTAIVLGVIVFPLIPALRDLFRGGPRPPSHPLPGDDSRLLTRRRSKSAIGC